MSTRGFTCRTISRQTYRSGLIVEDVGLQQLGISPSVTVRPSCRSEGLESDPSCARLAQVNSISMKGLCQPRPVSARAFTYKLASKNELVLNSARLASLCDRLHTVHGSLRHALTRLFVSETLTYCGAVVESCSTLSSALRCGIKHHLRAIRRVRVREEPVTNQTHSHIQHRT